MEMFLVLRNWFVGTEGFIDVDQQMMMAAARKLIAGVGDAHPAQAQETPERATDGRSILG